jgi:S-formylglutathione hydrolase FrmB
MVTLLDAALPAAPAAPSDAPRVPSLPSLWERWRYRGGHRDVRLDLLRGFAAFAMVVDHIGGERSWLYPITGGNRFFVGAAEAFVLISGLVMGMVYAGIIARKGMQPAMAKLLGRVLTLYALTVLLTLAFAALSRLLDLPWQPRLAAGEVPAFVVGVVTLHQTYFLTDIPLLYTFLVLVGGGVLWLLARGHTWPVLAGSWALWALWQQWPEAAMFPWPIAGNTVFFIPAWQVIFVTALVIGYHRPAIERALDRWPVEFVFAGSTLLFAAVLFLYLRRPEALAEDAPLGVTLFDKEDVGVGRLAVLAVMGAFAYSLLTVAWAPIRRTLGWLLLPLGHHALAAYSFHIFVVAAVFKGLTISGVHPDVAGATALQLAGLLLVWAMVLLMPAAGGVIDACVHCTQASPLRHPFRHCTGRVREPPPTSPTHAAPVMDGPPALAWQSGGGTAAGAAAGRPAAPARGGPARGRLIMLVAAGLLVAGTLPLAGLHLRPDGSHTAPGGEAAASPLVRAFVADPETASGLSPARVETATIDSVTLGRSLPYLVFLPPGYDSGATARYPVLYMLHGIGGGYWEWTEYGVFETAERLIRESAIPPMLIVLPEGEQSYWVDHADGGAAWGTYVVRDLVGEIDRRYRTLADRGHRAVGGNSMGAVGALQLALNFPEVFGVVGAHSPTLRDRDSLPPYFGDQAYFEAHDPTSLILREPQVARSLRLWLDIGEGDYFLGTVTETATGSTLWASRTNSMSGPARTMTSTGSRMWSAISGFTGRPCNRDRPIRR